MNCKWWILLNLFLLRSSLAVDEPWFNFVLKIIFKLGPHYQISFFGCNRMDANLISKALSNYTYLNACTHKFNKFSSVRTWRRQLFIVDLNCGSSLLFKKANEENLFASPFAWLVIYKNISLQHLLEENLNDLNILVDSNFYLIELHENRSVSLRKIFKKHKLDKSYQIENFKFPDDEIKEIKALRTNIGVALNASFVLLVNDSINHLTDKRDRHLDATAKINYILIPLLVSKFNMTLNVNFVNSWGREVNATYGFTGMFRQLITKRTIDLAGSPIFIFKNRIPLLEYVAVTTTTQVKFIFRQPKLSYISNIYILPFDYGVWLSIYGLTILLTLTIFVVIKWERKADTSLQDTKHLSEENDTFIDAAFLTLSALCQQGCGNSPTSTPGKLATFVLYLSLMFIFVYYSANILALLQSPSNSITSLEDLLNSRMALGIHNTYYNIFFFSSAKEPLKKAIFEKKIAPPGRRPNYMELEEGIKTLKNGGFAFHMQLGSGYKIISETFEEHEKRGLHTIDFFGLSTPAFMAIQKNSSYKELLKIGFKVIQEIGIQKRENNLIYTKKPICSSHAAAQFIRVTIIDFYPVLVLFLGGWVLSIIIFILEHYYYSRTHS